MELKDEQRNALQFGAVSVDEVTGDFGDDEATEASRRFETWLYRHGVYGFNAMERSNGSSR